jgi:hypothetical protein
MGDSQFKAVPPLCKWVTAEIEGIFDIVWYKGLYIAVKFS